MTLKLAVAHEYPLVVAGLCALLEPYTDRVNLVETVVNAPVVNDVDIVLEGAFADQHTPPAGPRQLLRSPDTKLVVYGWHSSEGEVRAALDGGADGYVSKALPVEDLVHGLERVHRGERVVLKGGGDLDETDVLSRWPGDEHGLSARESEVLVLICQGLSNAEISQRSYIGINTVKSYIRSAYRKIGVTTRPQAVIWGLTHGFATEPQRL